MRRKAKAINFGIIYGISSYGLAKQISVSNPEAEQFLFSYFKKFPEIRDYMQETLSFVGRMVLFKRYLIENVIFQILMIKIIL